LIYERTLNTHEPGRDTFSLNLHTLMGTALRLLSPSPVWYTTKDIEQKGHGKVGPHSKQVCESQDDLGCHAGGPANWLNWGSEQIGHFLVLVHLLLPNASVTTHEPFKGIQGTSLVHQLLLDLPMLLMGDFRAVDAYNIKYSLPVGVL
jgi:hypothetical protein